MHVAAMKTRWLGWAAVLSVFAWLVPAAALAATATIQPIMDTTIYQGTDPVTLEVFEDNSCGAGTNLFSGMTADMFLRRALVKFPISQAEGGPIPPGSVINSVTLTINVNRAGAAVPVTMTLHPVSRDWSAGTANCDAVRGGGQGIAANPGDATWRDARFQTAQWATPGGDFGPASASASIPTGGDGSWTATGPASPLVVDVQRWMDNPAQNFGWMVVGQETLMPSTVRFSSSEGRAAPRLVIDYTPNGPTFACCFDTGSCNEFLVGDEGSCTGAGGIVNTAPLCSPNPCPQPIGACCNLDESCSNLVTRSACEAAGGFFNGAGSSCSDNNVNCGYEPFVDPLPLPGVLQPTSTTNGVPHYDITMEQVDQQLHRDLPPTTVWGYNGLYPGPTIEARSGQPIEVKYSNNLPLNGVRGRHLFEVDRCPHGPDYWQDTARTVPHLHGGHVPARFDGQPEYDFRPGSFDVYQYPNNQPAATLWYHDHSLGITRLNVYAGLAAFYLLRDSTEDNLGLPSGEFEVPLAIQDRSFFEDGQLYYPPAMTDSFFGDKVLVNGKVWPFLNVKQGKYRLRILNGSQARQYRLKLENRADPAQVIPFQLIGTDGGLISAPKPLNDFTMGPAERFDVVVDFSAFPAGTEIVLKNLQPQLPAVPNVMKFIVTNQVGFTNPLPTTLRAVTPIPVSEATKTRRFRLEQVPEACMGNEWLIMSLDANGNMIGHHWDDISEFPTLNSTEIWEFENPSNVMHPMHIHLVMFQVLGRTNLATGQSMPLQPWETGTWKDTVRTLPGTLTRVIMKFEGYLGKFPYHCHLLDHEDHEMMRQFQVTNSPLNCNNNGVCGSGEDCVSCPGDCKSVSGAKCGNQLCETGDGENYLNCPSDCAGKSKGAGTFACGNPAAGNFVGCDDPRCTTDFFCRMEPRVPACCGDALCEGQETATSCPNDCAQGGGGSACNTFTSRSACTADPKCVWQGGKSSGTCVDAPTCTPTGSEGPFGNATCSDGLDNDCDGLTDGADTGCQPTCVPTTEGPFGSQTCSDGLDNDCDGLTDGADPNCQNTVNCTTYADKPSCTADAACRWNSKTGTCLAR